MFASPRPGNKTHSLHVPSHTVPARENASLTEFQRDPRASITAFEFMVYLTNGVHEQLTVNLPPALATFTPIVAGLPTDPQQAAHDLHFVGFCVFLDESVFDFSTPFQYA
jgi:hypothetical protein